VFFGAGSAGVGVATMLKDYLVHSGLTEDEAIKTFYLVDSKGLVAHNRGDKLPAHKIALARTDPDTPRLKTLEEVIDWVKPTGLLGLSTTGGAFNESIVRKMAKFNKNPIIFRISPFTKSKTNNILALSNPSEKSECNFENAITWTDGAVLFASGSPFRETIYKGKTYTPGQGNNMYIFPGLGLGTILAQARRVTDNMILVASESLANCVTEEEFSRGLLYPDVSRIREVSLHLARDVIRTAQKEGVDGKKELRGLSDAELETYIKNNIYNPEDLKGRIESECAKL
jgi:malate dehydrogenase (oxaloacetate-decarboxylating)(NADP+)